MELCLTPSGNSVSADANREDAVLVAIDAARAKWASDHDQRQLRRELLRILAELDE